MFSMGVTLLRRSFRLMFPLSAIRGHSKLPMRRKLLTRTLRRGQTEIVRTCGAGSPGGEGGKREKKDPKDQIGKALHRARRCH
jgi:hypothetical protein